MLFPLPKGEGKGEGEGAIRMFSPGTLYPGAHEQSFEFVKIREIRVSPVRIRVHSFKVRLA